MKLTLFYWMWYGRDLAARGIIFVRRRLLLNRIVFLSCSVDLTLRNILLTVKINRCFILYNHKGPE